MDLAKLVEDVLADADPEKHSASPEKAAREQVIADAERFLATFTTSPTTGDQSIMTGTALRWSSIANGQKGATRFDPRAFGDRPLVVPFLYSHDTARPLGVITLTPTPDELAAEAKLSDTAFNKDVAKLIGDGVLSGLSVGFRVVKSHVGADGVRVVDRAELDEVSAVTMPADAAARIASLGGKQTPRYFHAADPQEREHAMAMAAPRRDRDQIIEQAQADLDRIVYGAATPSARENADDTWQTTGEMILGHHAACRYDTGEREEGRRAVETWESARHEWLQAHRPTNHGAW